MHKQKVNLKKLTGRYEYVTQQTLKAICPICGGSDETIKHGWNNAKSKNKRRWMCKRCNVHFSPD